MSDDTTIPTPVRGRFTLLKRILLVLAAIVVVSVMVVALQPAEFRIVRSATMAAPPSDVFPQVNDFHNWGGWSPWAKLDPEAKNTFEGPPAGEGAVFKWSGNDKIGEGIMTLTESSPHDLIRINLHFIKPFEDTSTTEFSFKPEGDQTVVTWSMYGRNNFISKAFCLFMNMDKMLGDDFEKGLASMKPIVEAKSS